MPVESVIYKFKNQFSFVRAQIVLLLEVKEIHLSSREIDAFTWVAIDGWNEATHDKIRSLRILKGNGIDNLGSKLIKKNLLTQPRKGVKVIPNEYKIYSNGFLKAGFCTEDFLNKIQKVGEKV